MTRAMQQEIDSLVDTAAEEFQIKNFAVSVGVFFPPFIQQGNMWITV